MSTGTMRFAMLFSLMPLVIGACNNNSNYNPVGITSSPVTSTETPTYRDIEIELLTAPAAGDLFEIGEVFTLRDREGFQIWTHQANFWQPGDWFRADSLQIVTVFDDAVTVEPFYFWPNGSYEEVYNDSGEQIGGYLATGMTISTRTTSLALGDHTLTVSVETPHGDVFSQTWAFAIHEREIARLPIPAELASTAEYLSQYPLPTPVYIERLSAETVPLDRFSPIGVGEGICFLLDDESFVPPDVANNPFRTAMWEAITIAVNDVPLRDDQFGFGSSDTPGRVFLCFDTDHLAAGTHLAEISVTVNGTAYSHVWAFVIE